VIRELAPLNRPTAGRLCTLQPSTRWCPLLRDTIKTMDSDSPAT
jgi:hypothetical protein